MNAIEFLSGDQRRQLWNKLAPELKLHEQLEADCFYGPLASEAGSRDQTLANWSREHEQEVREAEGLIAKISGATPADPRWMDSLHQLTSALERHIQKEEGEIWPKARNVWDAARLDQAGRQMEQRHQQAA